MYKGGFPGISGKVFRFGVMSAWLALSASQSLAEMSPQEQEVLKEIRQIYVTYKGRQPTAAEEETMLDQWRQSVMKTAVAATRFNAMASGKLPAQMAAAAAPQPTALASMSEEELAQKIQALGAGKPGSSIEGHRDGLRINGAGYADPEGKVSTYAYNSLTGDITYSIQSGDGQVFKYMKAGSNAEPISFASVSYGAADATVNTVTGKKITGSVVTPTATGLLVYRGGSVFRYEPGKGMKSFTVPDGWVPTPIQRGNVGATGYILLERIQMSSDAAGGLGGLFNAAKSLGATAGLNKKEDYALLNLETGALFPLNVQAEGKTQTVMTNCVKKNSFVNECAKGHSFESLYTDIGRNYGHYYWSVDWHMTPSGPIAVTMENGQKDVFIIDLKSSKKVNAFHRALGISSLDISQSPTGVVALKAGWMFKTFPIDDAVKHLNDSPAVGG
jgi:hypothetical protein